MPRASRKPTSEARGSARPRVLVVRGHMASPAELGAWEPLAGRFDVTLVQTGSAWHDTSALELPQRRARAVRDVLPRGPLGDLLVRLPGDRYLRPRAAFADADIVHAKELGSWFAAQAAALKDELGFKLVLSASETIPIRETYRNVRTRPYRRRTLAAADRFFATTERAAGCLRLEGVDDERIRVLPPGIDAARFGAAAPTARRHTILSPGRLVWEKGHQDVLRAVAAIRAGVVAAPVREPLVVIAGSGPERRRLERYAGDLGVADLVRLPGRVAYDEMAALYGSASCLVLGSIPTWSWEEQFGFVLAEGLAARVPLVVASSGSIPEVCGDDATYFTPGDWLGLARALAAGPLARDPAFRASPDPARVRALLRAGAGGAPRRRLRRAARPARSSASSAGCARPRRRSSTRRAGAQREPARRLAARAAAADGAVLRAGAARRARRGRARARHAGARDRARPG